MKKKLTLKSVCLSMMLVIAVAVTFVPTFAFADDYIDISQIDLVVKPPKCGTKVEMEYTDWMVSSDQGAYLLGSGVTLEVPVIYRDGVNPSKIKLNYQWYSITKEDDDTETYESVSGATQKTYRVTKKGTYCCRVWEPDWKSSDDWYYEEVRFNVVADWNEICNSNGWGLRCDNHDIFYNQNSRISATEKIVFNNYTSVSESDLTYQWAYRDDDIYDEGVYIDIPGATEESYTIIKPGHYQCVITDGIGNEEILYCWKPDDWYYINGANPKPIISSTTEAIESVEGEWVDWMNEFFVGIIEGGKSYRYSFVPYNKDGYGYTDNTIIRQNGIMLGTVGSLTFGKTHYGKIIAEHDLIKTVAKSPLPGVAGNREYYTCRGCGKHFSDSAGKNEIVAGSWMIAPLPIIKAITVNTKTVNAKAIDKVLAAKQGDATHLTTIVLGPKVKKISKGTFKGYKNVKTLEVKTKKLKKASVKGSLQGSNIKTVKVQVGNKKTNKRYIKKYKTVFTKKNVGKKVRIM